MFSEGGRQNEQHIGHQQPRFRVTSDCYHFVVDREPNANSETQRTQNLTNFAQFVQWHFEQIQSNYDQAGKNTLSLLGFNGVMLTLAADRLSELDGVPHKLVFIGTLLLIAALGASLFAMVPRKIHSVQSAGLQAEMKSMRTTTSTFVYPAQGLEHLLHSATESSGKSPLLHLTEAVHRRGRHLLVTMCLTAAGAACFGVGLLFKIGV